MVHEMSFIKLFLAVVVALQGARSLPLPNENNHEGSKPGPNDALGVPIEALPETCKHA